KVRLLELLQRVLVAYTRPLDRLGRAAARVDIRRRRDRRLEPRVVERQVAPHHADDDVDRRRAFDRRLGGWPPALAVGPRSRRVRRVGRGGLRRFAGPRALCPAASARLAAARHGWTFLSEAFWRKSDAGIETRPRGCPRRARASASSSGTMPKPCKACNRIMCWCRFV